MIKSYTLPEKIIDIEQVFKVAVYAYSSSATAKVFSTYEEAEEFIIDQLVAGYNGELSIEKYYRLPKKENNNG